MRRELGPKESRTRAKRKIEMLMYLGLKFVLLESYELERLIEKGKDENEVLCEHVWLSREEESEELRDTGGRDLKSLSIM